MKNFIHILKTNKNNKTQTKLLKQTKIKTENMKAKLFQNIKGVIKWRIKMFFRGYSAIKTSFRTQL